MHSVKFRTIKGKHKLDYTLYTRPRKNSNKIYICDKDLEKSSNKINLWDKQRKCKHWTHTAKNPIRKFHMPSSYLIG